MEGEELRLEVKKVLTSLEDINPNEVSKPDGMLDFKKLGKNQQVLTAMNQLNSWGITRKYLLRYFNIAGLTLGHLLEN